MEFIRNFPSYYVDTDYESSATSDTGSTTQIYEMAPIATHRPFLIMDFDRTVCFKEEPEITRRIVATIKQCKVRNDLVCGIITGNSAENVFKVIPEEDGVIDFIYAFNCGRRYYCKSKKNFPCKRVDTTDLKDTLAKMDSELREHILKFDDFEHCVCIKTKSGNDELTMKLYECLNETLGNCLKIYAEKGKSVITVYNYGCEKVNWINFSHEMRQYLHAQPGYVAFVGDQIYPEGNDYAIAMSSSVSVYFQPASPSHAFEIFSFIIPEHFRAFMPSNSTLGYKDDSFDSEITSFCNFVHSKSYFAVDEVMPFYDRVKPTMHSSPTMNWLCLQYAIDRLPRLLFNYSTISLVMPHVNFSNEGGIGESAMLMTKNRPRLTFLDDKGSNLFVILRDNTIDVYDIVSMLCAFKKEFSKIDNVRENLPSLQKCCEMTGFLAASENNKFPLVSIISSPLGEMMLSGQGVLQMWIQDIRKSIFSMLPGATPACRIACHILVSSKRVVTNALGLHNSIKFANVTLLVSSKFGLYKALVIHANMIKSFIPPQETLFGNTFFIIIPHMFGAQSRSVVKLFANELGRCIASVNIVGKCGGLVGKRGDIIICEKVLARDSEDPKAVHREIDLKKRGLASKTWNQDMLRTMMSYYSNSDVHSGTIYGAKGTLLQSEAMLLELKKSYGVIGIEMESFYLASSLLECMSSGLLNSNIIMRAAYYISDIPLNPEQNLDREVEITNYKGIVYPMILATQSILCDIRVNRINQV